MTSPFSSVCSAPTIDSAIVPPSSARSKVRRWPDLAAARAERNVTVPAGGVAASSSELTTRPPPVEPEPPPALPPPQAPIAASSVVATVHANSRHPRVIRVLLGCTGRSRACP